MIKLPAAISAIGVLHSAQITFVDLSDTPSFDVAGCIDINDNPEEIETDIFCG